MKLIWLALSMVSSLGAQQFELHQAEAFLQLHQPDKAIPIYQNLLQESSRSWERAVYLYDLGVAQMANKEWNQAINSFKVVAENSSEAVINARAKKNLALASYYQAKNGAEEEAKQGFMQALKYVQEAQDADCKCQKMEGYVRCMPDPMLERLKKAIEDELKKQTQPIDRIQEALKKLNKPPGKSKPKPAQKQATVSEKLVNELYQMSEQDGVPRLKPVPATNPEDKPW